MEEQLNAGIHRKSGKSLMNAFLRARTAFGFEYLIRFRAEHSDADRDITGIEGLLFSVNADSNYTSGKSNVTYYLSVILKGPVHDVNMLIVI